MQFIATRSKEKVNSATAILSAVPTDGGLFVPETFPEITGDEWTMLAETDYAGRVAFVLEKYFGDLATKEEWQEIAEKAYSDFEGDDPVPLVRVDDGMYILELIHGKTSAHEDICVSLLPYIIEKCRKVSGEKRPVLMVNGSTGDDGKALMETFKDVENTKVAVFYADSINRMQRIQLSVQDGKNVYACAVKGTYEDAKKAVDKLFERENKKEIEDKGYVLTTMTGTNIAMIIPRIACFISAYLDLVNSEQISFGEKIDFAIPAGNADNLLACYYAMRSGLPVRNMLCASNRNKATAEFFKKGELNLKRPVYSSMAPMLNIVFPENLERFVFEAVGRNEEVCKERMTAEEVITIKPCANPFPFVKPYHGAEDEIVDYMYEIFEEYGYAMDTHTGVAIYATGKAMEERNEKDKTKTVVLAVDNPYKFSQAVLYCLSGDDVKDSFKGVKRLNLLTAMKPPKWIAEIRYKDFRFADVVTTDEVKKKVTDMLK